MHVWFRSQPETQAQPKGLSLCDPLFSETPLSVSSSCGHSGLCPLVTRQERLQLLSELQLFCARSQLLPASGFYIYIYYIICIYYVYNMYI